METKITNYRKKTVGVPPPLDFHCRFTVIAYYPILLIACALMPDYLAMTKSANLLTHAYSDRDWETRGVVSEYTDILNISNGAAGAFYGPHENVRLLARRNGSKVGEIYAKARTLYLL